MSRKKNKNTSTKSRRRTANQTKSYIPLIIVIGGIILVGGALFALWKSQQPATQTTPIKVSGQPSLEVDRDFVDFGDVPLNKVVSVSFNIVNVGDQALKFTANPYVEVVEGC